MNIFVYRNGNQEGPFDREDLKKMNIRPDTMVWYKGLTEWVPASQADATAFLFSQPEPPQPPFGQPGPQNPGPQNPGPQYPGPQYPQPGPGPDQAGVEEIGEYPNEYKTPSIILIVISVLCCCNMAGLVLGIVALVKSNSIEGLYDAGRYAEAESASKTAKICVYIGYAITVLAIILGVLYNLLMGIAGGFN